MWICSDVFLAKNTAVMRIKLTLFFLILWTGVQMLSAQTLGNYTFSTGIDATKWIPLTTTTNLLTVGSGSTTHPYDSRRSTVLDIGFTFTFGSEQYTKFSVNSDGNLRFGTTATGFANYSPPLQLEQFKCQQSENQFFRSERRCHLLPAQLCGDAAHRP